MDRNGVQVAPFVPGVARFEARPVIDSALAVLAASIEGAMPMFVKGSTAFTAGSEAIARRSDDRLASLDALGRAARRQFTVELVGEADADGAAESNLPLSQRRAERVLRPARAAAPGARDAHGQRHWQPHAPLRRVSDESDKQRNRRVSFHVDRGADRPRIARR